MDFAQLEQNFLDTISIFACTRTQNCANFCERRSRISTYCLIVKFFDRNQIPNLLNLDCRFKSEAHVPRFSFP